MRLLPLLLLAVSRCAALTLCGVSANWKVGLNDTCTHTNGGGVGYATVDVAAARGEFEAGAIILDNTASAEAAPACSLSVSWDGGSAPVGVSFTVRMLGYVHTEASPRYAGSVAGWFADALLPWPSGGLDVAPHSQLTAWVTFDVSASAAPGTYTGTIAVPGAAAPLPLVLTVWSLTIPPLATSPFTTVYAFDESALSILGPARDVNATLRSYWDALSSLRFPATNIYATAPLPMWQYEALAAGGAQMLILADISSLPQADGSVWRGHGGPRSATRSANPSASSAACPSFDAAYVARMEALLRPTWEALGALGLQHRAAVYGFDEIVVGCEPVVRQLFAAAKAAFPGVQTMSALDWASVPLDMPLDIWVLQYQLVDAATAAAWTAAGHSLFVYHCIEPSGAGYLNTFNDGHDLIEARELFWFDFALGVTGHLYYDVALWLDWTALPPFWASYETVSGVSFERAHAPIALGGNDVRLLQWDPANVRAAWGAIAIGA